MSHIKLCSLSKYSCYIAHSTVNNNQAINHYNTIAKYVVKYYQNQIPALLGYHFSMLLFTFEFLYLSGLRSFILFFLYIITLTLWFTTVMICLPPWYTYTILNDYKTSDTMHCASLSDNQQHTVSDRHNRTKIKLLIKSLPLWSTWVQPRFYWVLCC